MKFDKFFYIFADVVIVAFFLSLDDKDEEEREREREKNKE